MSLDYEIQDSVVSHENDTSYKVVRRRKKAMYGMEYDAQEIVFSVPLGIDAAYLLNEWWVINHVLPEMKDFYPNEDLATRCEMYFKEEDTGCDHDVQLYEELINYIEQQYIKRLNLNDSTKNIISSHMGCYPNGEYIESSNFLFCITPNIPTVEMMYAMNKEFNSPENKIILNELKKWLCDIVGIHDINEFRFRPLAFFIKM